MSVSYDVVTAEERCVPALSVMISLHRLHDTVPADWCQADKAYNLEFSNPDRFRSVAKGIAVARPGLTRRAGNKSV